MNLSTLLTKAYTPTAETDFAGPARNAARFIDRLIARNFADRCAPFKLSLIGPPGVGKSALAKFTWSRLTSLSVPSPARRALLSVVKSEPPADPVPTAPAPSASAFDLFKYAGRDVDVERVRSLAETVQYAPSGPYRLIWIDEADGMSPAALQRFLPLLDDFPNGNAIILTSNSDLSKIEERFDTRFKTLQVTGPTADDLLQFLMPYLPAPDPQQIHTLKQIIANCKGNVRQAIEDLDSYLLTL